MSNCLFFLKRFQATRIAFADSRLGFDLDSEPVAHDEIDLMPMGRTPEAQRLPEPSITQGTANLHRDKMFKTPTIKIGIAFDLFGASEGVCHSRIKEVELRRADRFAPFRIRPRKKKETDERIFEELIVFADRRRRNLRVTGERNPASTSSGSMPGQSEIGRQT